MKEIGVARAKNEAIKRLVENGNKDVPSEFREWHGGLREAAKKIGIQASEMPTLLDTDDVSTDDQDDSRALIKRELAEGLAGATRRCKEIEDACGMSPQTLEVADATHEVELASSLVEAAEGGAPDAMDKETALALQKKAVKRLALKKRLLQNVPPTEAVQSQVSGDTKKEDELQQKKKKFVADLGRARGKVRLLQETIEINAAASLEGCGNLRADLRDRGRQAGLQQDEAPTLLDDDDDMDGEGHADMIAFKNTAREIFDHVNHFRADVNARHVHADRKWSFGLSDGTWMNK